MLDHTQHPEYLHTVEGRMRVKVGKIKGSQMLASRLERAVQALDGITHVSANATTGNVLILFDSNVTTHQQILQFLSDSQMLGSNPGVDRRRGDHASNGLADALVEQLLKTLIEVAARRLILAVI